MAYTLIQVRVDTEAHEVSEVTQDAVPSLDQLQKFVGGYIETVPLFDSYKDKPAVAFCHEEGKLEGRPVNKTATAMWRDALGFAADDYLVGEHHHHCG